MGGAEVSGQEGVPPGHDAGAMVRKLWGLCSKEQGRSGRAQC